MNSIRLLMKFVFLVILCSALTITAQQSGGEHPWVPDNGDGTYRNPVIFADYSDPDVIRVGDDYYLTSSSFSNFPGLPVLHSKDLVNWTITANAVQQYPYTDFSSPQHGMGIWAPAIRYHNNEFYIYFGDPDNGILMTKAKKASGPWEPLKVVKKATGWIDPCPFWDDDGNAYLVHAWAKSRAGFNSILTINRMSPDGTEILDEGKTIFDGTKNHPTIEGPKLYKRNGFYYIFAPAGGVKPGWQTVLRSKNIYGPYEDKIVLEQGSTKTNGPHQGALIETTTGESWFIHFRDFNAYGRITYLEPVEWIKDSSGGEWPLVGQDYDNNGIGEPVSSFLKPSIQKEVPVTVPPATDEFDSTEPGLQWQWQSNFRNSWYSLKNHQGRLRLYTENYQDDSTNLYNTGNLFMQKFPAPAFTVLTKLKLTSDSAGAKAGVIIFGTDYSYIALEKYKRGFRVIHGVCFNADKGEAEKILFAEDTGADSVYLKIIVQPSDDGFPKCLFSFSMDGNIYKDTGVDFKAKPGKWVGAKTGLFALKPSGDTEIGSADFDWFRITK